MKILVIGASGFIGRNLLPFLTKQGTGDTVFAVVRSIPNETIPNVRWIKADLGDAEWTKCLPNEHFETIIHLAQSKHYRDFPGRVDDIFKINVQATIELAEWALGHCVKRFLFASTGNVYGFKNSVHIEDDRCDPETMYGASKLCAEILLKPFSKYMDVLILRLFGVYGPGQTDAMLPRIIQRFNSGEEITLSGNVGVRFNPIYVDDCAAAIHVITKAKSTQDYEVINVGGSEIVDLRQVIELMESYSSIKARVGITSEQATELVGSVEKLNSLYHIKRGVSFEDGFLRTFLWSKNIHERI